MGALANFVQKHFGVQTRYNDTPLTTSVSTTVAQIWRNNADRIMLLIVNNTSYTCYVGTEAAVSSTTGVRLNANGDAMVYLAEEDGELVSYPIWILATGSGTIFTAEVEGI